MFAALGHTSSFPFSRVFRAVTRLRPHRYLRRARLEQTAVATRMMYAAPNRRTTHGLVRLDVPMPFWMRAPGKCPAYTRYDPAATVTTLPTTRSPKPRRTRPVGLSTPGYPLTGDDAHLLTPSDGHQQPRQATGDVRGRAP